MGGPRLVFPKPPPPPAPPPPQASSVQRSVHKDALAPRRLGLLHLLEGFLQGLLLDGPYGVLIQTGEGRGRERETKGGQHS